MKKVLVTGGCGFIGSHLIERLLKDNWETLIIDNLSPQVHSHGVIIPKSILDHCQLIKDDIRNIVAWKNELKDVKAIIHLASETGVGQSMYEIERYTSINVTGTGIILDQLFSWAKNVEKIIIASSRAVYGEGDYQCKKCGVVRPQTRTVEDLKSQRWETVCPNCSGVLNSIPTKELSPTEPVSIYGITKLCQEQLAKITCNTLGIECAILRYQNVYGPLQSLTNPYTGILSTFSTRIQNNLPLEIYEDGLMSRDFVYVSDVVNATMKSLYKEGLQGITFNVGSGKKTTIIEVAETLIKAFGSETSLKFNNHFRIGDIRHCYADISKIKRQIGFSPKIELAKGIHALVEWVLSQPKKDDFSKKAFYDLLKNKIYQ